jgi:hypothetical protein
LGFLDILRKNKEAYFWMFLIIFIKEIKENKTKK